MLNIIVVVLITQASSIGSVYESPLCLLGSPLKPHISFETEDQKMGILLWGVEWKQALQVVS